MMDKITGKKYLELASSLLTSHVCLTNMYCFAQLTSKTRVISHKTVTNNKL